MKTERKNVTQTENVERDLIALKEEKAKLEQQLHQREEQLLNLLSFMQGAAKAK